MNKNLNLLKDGQHYDAEIGSKHDDIQFYLKAAGDRSLRILELGVGTGRVSLPLAEAGHEMIGIDDSQSMLDQAQRKFTAASLRISLIRADIRVCQLPSDVDLAICPFNTIMHLSSADLITLFSKLSSELKSHGRFIIDVANPEMMKLAPGETKSFRTVYLDPASGDEVHLSSIRSNFENKAHLIRTFKRKDGTPISDEFIEWHLVNLEEWMAVIWGANFSVKAKYGSYDLSPYSPESSRLIILIEKND